MTTQLSEQLTARENEILFDKGMNALTALKKAGLKFAIASDRDTARCLRGLIVAALGIEPAMVEWLADAGVTMTIKIGLAQSDSKPPAPKRRT